MSDKPLILVVDDDVTVRDSLCTLLQTYEFGVKGYSSAHHFLSEQDPRGDCLIIDIRLPAPSKSTAPISWTRHEPPIFRTL